MEHQAVGIDMGMSGNAIFGEVSRGAGQVG